MLTNVAKIDGMEFLIGKIIRRRTDTLTCYFYDSNSVPNGLNMAVNVTFNNVSYIVVVIFIGGGNWSRRRKPQGLGASEK